MSQAAPSIPSEFDAAPEPRAKGPRRRRRLTALEAQKRSFLRMASHELRTPLNSILGFSEILADELYGPLGAPQYKEYAQLIRTSGDRLLKLVNQILDIARLEGHAMDLSPRAQPLDHVLDDVIDSLREDIRLRRTEVAVIDEGRLPGAFADPKGLRTVVSNLLHNAVVFSPEEARIVIETRRLGDEVELRITDPGPGVPADDVPRLLRPFEQGDNALTRRSQGAGLGLPIALLLCEAMGGSLELQSSTGQGLTARILLPAAIAPEDVAA